jgi:amyloid beta (A4) precursor protein-binding family B protein 2 (Fe65-like)
MCHVFRCDTPARQIANTLRDICQKIMLERSKGLVPDAGHSLTQRSLAITRPNNLPVGQLPDGQKITFESLFNSEYMKMFSE